MTPARVPLAAFGAVGLAIALFSGMDVVMKELSLALGVASAMFWRNLAGVPISGVQHFAGRPERPKPEAMRLHLRRGAVSVFMGLTFFYSITVLPLAEAVALSFISPLVALYLAAVLLGEKVGKRAVAGSLLGFSGMLLMVAAKLGEGGGGASDPALLGIVAVLTSAVLYAYNLILMRRQAQVAAPSEIAFYQSVILVALLGPAMPFVGAAPAPGHLPLILLGAVLAQVSLMLFAHGYARAEAQRLAPMEYSALIWAALFGWLFYREQVGPATIAGAALIVAGCWLAARPQPAPASPAEAA